MLHTVFCQRTAVWFLKPANFNRRHIGRTHWGRGVVLFVIQNEREKEKEIGKAAESPGEESPVKRDYRGHFQSSLF